MTEQINQKMKIYDIIPNNWYSCTFCQKHFLSEKELILFFFCSKNCQFKYAFSIVSEVFPTASKEKQFALTKNYVRFV